MVKSVREKEKKGVKTVTCIYYVYELCTCVCILERVYVHESACGD